MSERYGECRSCTGPGCFVCSGSGFTGDVIEHLNSNQGWGTFLGRGAPHLGIEAAVLSINTFMQIQKESREMSNLVTNNQSVTVAQKFGYTEKQLDLVKRTVAKNATDDELELFFYRCKELQLNPLMPGQVYFLKFGNNPGTVIVGLDGFRAKAQRTGKLAGIKRGVIRDEKGKCTGAWADVYRKDWDHPAHEEVSLAEYADPRKPIWKNMPETMIKKVAEVAALRMAFPDDLGGIYLREEMDQAEAKEVRAEVGERKPSEAQLKRLFAIAKAHNVSNEELKVIMVGDYGIESSKDLTLAQYNELCDLLESRVETPIEREETTLEPQYEALE